jgi:hypothetical protein
VFQTVKTIHLAFASLNIQCSNSKQYIALILHHSCCYFMHGATCALQVACIIMRPCPPAVLLLLVVWYFSFSLLNSLLQLVSLSRMLHLCSYSLILIKIKVFLAFASLLLFKRSVVLVRISTIVVLPLSKITLHSGFSQSQTL